jgi:hypothetical protein
MKPFRIPVPEWRRNFFDSKKGIPTISTLCDEISAGKLPGCKIAEVYIVYCNADYEPLWDMDPIPEVSNDEPSEPEPEVTNPIAAKILAQHT